MLPGLGLLPGEKRPMMANVVRVTSHYNEVLYVSSGFPNRISTPFAAPKLIDNSEVEWQVQGQSLYLSPKSPEKPVGIAGICFGAAAMLMVFRFGKKPPENVK